MGIKAQQVTKMTNIHIIIDNILYSFLANGGHLYTP